MTTAPSHYNIALRATVATAIAAGAGAAGAYALALPTVAGASLVGGAYLVGKLGHHLVDILGKCLRRGHITIFIINTARAIINFVAKTFVLVATSALTVKAAVMLGYSFGKITAIAASWHIPGALLTVPYLNVGAAVVVVVALTILVVSKLASSDFFKDIATSILP